MGGMWAVYTWIKKKAAGLQMGASTGYIKKREKGGQQEQNTAADETRWDSLCLAGHLGWWERMQEPEGGLIDVPIGRACGWVARVVDGGHRTRGRGTRIDFAGRPLTELPKSCGPLEGAQIEGCRSRRGHPWMNAKAPAPQHRTGNELPKRAKGQRNEAFHPHA